MLKVALLQMTPHGADIAANQAKGEEFCRRAAELGADIALFPEVWSNGYSFYDPQDAASRERWAAQAVARDDAFVKHFQALARELNLAIGLTYLERGATAPRDAMSLIDRHGEILFTYAKVHTCDFDVECALERGEEFFVSDLDTAEGTVRVGAMICYDREFPESARVLMLRGAELVLVPNACDMEINRVTQLRVRSFENMMAIALCNYAAPREDGHSVAFDGMATGAADSFRDMCVILAGQHEGIFMAEFDVQALRAYRAFETWGNAYRRPAAYADLVSPRVDPPFVRPDARR